MLIVRRIAYLGVLAIAVMIGISQAGIPLQSQSAKTQEMLHRFPANSVECDIGDYIITKSRSGGWTVYQVRDLFFMSRLSVMKDTSGLIVVEQIAVADSATPPKWQEIQLLLNEFKKEFGTREKAIEAIESSNLGDSVQGLCRGVKDFPKQSCFAYKKK